MEKSYIYTMPEQFMEDESVPVKWRLYGIINGFWISGCTVFAGNEHFSKLLNCSERQISRALSDLESLGLLTRNVKGFKRTILPRVTSDVTLTSGDKQGRHGASGKHDMGRQHNSISNSTNKKKKEVPPKKPYGEFNNVLLTDDEKESLKSNFGTSKAKEMVEQLSTYIESSGKRYKSHYATIRQWLRRDGVMPDKYTS